MAAQAQSQSRLIVQSNWRTCGKNKMCRRDRAMRVIRHFYLVFFFFNNVNLFEAIYNHKNPTERMSTCKTTSQDFWKIEDILMPRKNFSDSLIQCLLRLVKVSVESSDASNEIQIHFSLFPEEGKMYSLHQSLKKKVKIFCLETFCCCCKSASSHTALWEKLPFEGEFQNCQLPFRYKDSPKLLKGG